MKIIGVDFSGAKSDRNTWISVGTLQSNRLVLKECHPATRGELTDILANRPEPTIAALDFPFSVPLEFANFWQPEATTMPELWSAADAMTMEVFLELRDQFVLTNGELKRLSDTFYPECYSPLHKANPNLVPMTFRGMQMMHQLSTAACSIPPLEPPSKAQTVLLEAMPGAALKAMGLPYKGYKRGANFQERRREILDQLANRAGLDISNLENFRQMGMANDDALDSLVASVIACLWALDPAKFRRPDSPEEPGFQPRVLLEGWLYAPVHLHPAP